MPDILRVDDAKIVVVLDPDLSKEYLDRIQNRTKEKRYTFDFAFGTELKFGMSMQPRLHLWLIRSSVVSMPLYLLMDQQEEVWSADCASILNLKSSNSGFNFLTLCCLCELVPLLLISYCYLFLWILWHCKQSFDYRVCLATLLLLKLGGENEDYV